jgi:glutathione S-transferase
MPEALLPPTIYGSNISYFTEKLEFYLRKKAIPYTFKTLNARRDMPLLQRETGATQIPAVVLADGRWKTDTTPMIAWLKRFTTEAGGVTYKNARASAYRVWCLAQLRAQFQALPADCAEITRLLLQQHGCREPLWRIDRLETRVNRTVLPPFGTNAKMP